MSGDLRVKEEEDRETGVHFQKAAELKAGMTCSTLRKARVSVGNGRA